MTNQLALAKEEAAPAKKLARWLGKGFDVASEGERVVVTSKDDAWSVLSPDGQTLAIRSDEGKLSVLNPKTGPQWSMRSWIDTWHSNVGGAPGRLWAEFPATGDAMLVRCEADAGMVGVESERVVDRATGRIRAETPSHLQQGASYAFSPDGIQLAIVFAIEMSDSPMLHVFDARSGRHTDSAIAAAVAWGAGGELVPGTMPCVDGR